MTVRLILLVAAVGWVWFWVRMTYVTIKRHELGRWPNRTWDGEDAVMIGLLAAVLVTVAALLAGSLGWWVVTG